MLSELGKESVIALRGPGSFFGEGCLDGRPERVTAVTTTNACEILRLDQSAVTRALADDPAFSRIFPAFLVDRTEKLKADLLDQIFHSSEKRRARILLTLAKSGITAEPNVIASSATQDVLADMVGTTRLRINQFMTKFRKLGYLDYDRAIRVHNALLDIIFEEPQNDDGAEPAQR